MIQRLLITVGCGLIGLSITGCNTESPTTGGDQVSSILDSVIERDTLRCGVRPKSSPFVGFADVDNAGDRFGFDIDFCKATAVAILGDANKVTYIELSANERLAAVANRDVDVLYRNTSYSLDRDTNDGVDFPGTSFFGGVGFLSREQSISSLNEVANSIIICTHPDPAPDAVGGTLPEYMVSGKDYLSNNSISYTEHEAVDSDAAYAAFLAGTCNMISNTRAELAIKNVSSFDGQGFSILDEVTVLDPMGPVVDEGDEQWFNLVAGILNALIRADELGITSANVESMLSSPNSEITDFLGQSGSLYSGLGIRSTWAFELVNSVGSYSEIYDRNFGSNPEIMLPAGNNDLVQNGGLLDSSIIN